MHKTLLMLALAGSLLLSSAFSIAWDGIPFVDEALELEPDLERGRMIFDVCSACHGTEGWGTHSGLFPQIAGQHRGVIIKQLNDIRALNRDNPTMYPFTLAKWLPDAQALADVTGYIETLPMTPDHGKGPWREGWPEYEIGKRMYQEHCVDCHGERGEGDRKKHHPRIQGQHYRYMVRQFEWIRDGRRRNADRQMVKQIHGFSHHEVQLVINYVSHIPLPEEDLAPSVHWRNPDFRPPFLRQR